MTIAEITAIITTGCAIVAALGTIAGLVKLWQVAHSVNGMKQAAERAEYERGQRDEKAAEANPRTNTNYERT